MGIIAIGDDIAVDIQNDFSRIACFAAETAHTHADRRAAFAGDIDHAGDIRAAVAAAAADGLRDHCGRIIAAGSYQIVSLCGFNRAGNALCAAAAAAETAHADGYCAAVFLGKIDRAGDVHRAISATTAEGLGDDAAGIISRGNGAAGDGVHHRKSFAAVAAETAHADCECATAGFRRRKGAGDVHAAVAAAAAERLRENTRRIVALSLDVAADGIVNFPCITAAATTTTDANTDGTRTCFCCGDRAGNVHAAIASAAAKGLGGNADAKVSGSVNVTGDFVGDFLRVAAVAAGTANADGESSAAVLGEGNRAADVKPAISTTTANGLGEDATGMFRVVCRDEKSAHGIDASRNENAGGDHVSDDGVVHGVGIITATAGAAHAKGRREASIFRRGKGTGRAEAAVATATADRLGNNAGGILPDGGDVTGVRGNDVARVAAVAAGSAEADRSGRAAFARTADGRANAKAAIAAAAADGLGKESERIVAAGLDVADDVGSNPGCVTAGAGAATEADAKGAAASARSGAGDRDIECAISTAAADGLGNDAGGIAESGFDGVANR